MNDLLTFGDTSPVPTDLTTLLLALMLAFLCGQVIAWVYMFTHNGLSYSRSFVNALIIIPITVSMVMMVLDNNIVTAFSLLAVFAIVRFRNILRDTLDTVYVLAVIVVGLATGTQKFTTAITGVGVMTLVFLYLWFTSFGARQRFDLILNFTLSAVSNSVADVEALLDRHSLQRIQASYRTMEKETDIFMSYRLRLRDPDRTDLLLREVKALSGISGVSVMKTEDESEV